MSGIAKILEDMNANPKGVRFNDLQKVAYIISGNHARAVVVIVPIKRHGLGIRV